MDKMFKDLKVMSLRQNDITNLSAKHIFIALNDGKLKNLERIDLSATLVMPSM